MNARAIGVEPGRQQLLSTLKPWPCTWCKLRLHPLKERAHESSNMIKKNNNKIDNVPRFEVRPSEFEARCQTIVVDVEALAEVVERGLDQNVANFFEALELQRNTHHNTNRGQGSCIHGMASTSTTQGQVLLQKQTQSCKATERMGSSLRSYNRTHITQHNTNRA